MLPLGWFVENYNHFLVSSLDPDKNLLCDIARHSWNKLELYPYTKTYDNSYLHILHNSKK